MNDWHTTCFGLKRLPRELTAFDIEAFFNFSPAERRVIEERRGPELMLGLAVQIGFLRMSGRGYATLNRRDARAHRPHCSNPCGGHHPARRVPLYD